MRYWMYIEVDRAFRYVSAYRYCSFNDLQFCAPMRPLVSVHFAFCGEGSKVANPSRQGRYPALADLACKHEGGVPSPALQCFIRLATLPGLCLSASSVPMPLASWRPAATKRPPERYTGGPPLSRRRARPLEIRLAGTPAGRFAATMYTTPLLQAPACKERRAGAMLAGSFLQGSVTAVERTQAGAACRSRCMTPCRQSQSSSCSVP